MKAIILAGGFGTRLSEETRIIPKPMVEIGGRPILWHIMKLYEQHGIVEFVICLGYKADLIKRFFLEYSSTLSNFTVDLKDDTVSLHSRKEENWKVTLLDTGLHTMTGGRMAKAFDELDIQETTCLTYGDGLSDVNISRLIESHKASSRLATVTAVTPPGRFGVLDIDHDSSLVSGFREKITSDQYRINGGFFVIEPEIREYISSDKTVWEKEPLQKLAAASQLNAFLHDGFWQPMDTLREKEYLQELWETGNSPWLLKKT